MNLRYEEKFYEETFTTKLDFTIQSATSCTLYKYPKGTSEL